MTDLILGNGVAVIGDYAFYFCSNLYTVSIPASITSIGNDAFYGCYDIVDVNIEDLTAWCNVNFADWYSGPLAWTQNLYIDNVLVTDLVIPDGVEHISDYAFYYCSAFTDLTISDSVKSIGNYAFSDCSRLTSITLPDSVKNIGEDAFTGCSELKSVYISDLAAWCNIIFDNKNSNPFYQYIEVADEYENWETVPLDVDLYVDGVLVTELVIPDGVRRIKDYAFCGWGKLSSLTISDSVYDIGSSAFAGCVNLNYVKIGGNVQYVGWNAFAYCNTLSSIEIPDSVCYIGESVFADCANLRYVKIGENVQGVGYNAFGGCTALETVTFMGDTKIVDENAFPDSKNLNHVHFLCDMPVIKKWAFGCEEVIEDNGDDYYEDDYYYDDYYGEESTKFLPTDVLLCYPEEAQKWNTYAYNISGTEYSHVITVDGAVATDKLVCSCGEVLRVTESHNHTYAYSDNGDSTHNEACSACGDIRVDHEPHTFADGVCIYCNALEPKDDAQLIFSSKTLSLRNYICFDFTVHNSVLEHYDSWFVIFERYDHELDSIVTTRVESEDFFNHQLLEIKLCSYQMADPFTATLYAVKDGTPYRGEVYTNSVAGYVNENIVNATSDAHRTLFANLVTYGAKAQIYMNYNTENLADAGLGEYASYVTTTIPTAETVFSETDKGLTGVTLNRTALGIASAVELQLALNVSDEYNANKIYAEMVYTGSNGQTVTERVEGKDFLDYGIFYVCIFRSLTAVDGRTPVEITVYDQSGNAISETWTYSIASYLDGSPLTGTALDTLHALINYFDSAEAYFSGVQQVEAT